MGENRFVLNTGENFGAGGAIQTSTSVYGAIGQALPTPPVEAIQEIAVNCRHVRRHPGRQQRRAHQRHHQIRHQRSCTAQLYEYFQNSVMNAAPVLLQRLAGHHHQRSVPEPQPVRRNLGGPIKKDKLFYFLSYQGVRIADAADSTKDVTVPLGLTNDRSCNRHRQRHLKSFGTTFTASQISPVRCRASAGQTAQRPISDPQRPNHQSPTKPRHWVTMPSRKDPTPRPTSIRASPTSITSSATKTASPAKYYFQNNPTTNPFGAVGILLGFPQQLSAGSQVGSIDNTIILTPSLTWQQHVGFTRMEAYSHTSQAFTPARFRHESSGLQHLPAN